MKRFLFSFIFSFFLLSSAFAQHQFRSENDARNYFQENILNLDPIEGIYDVENIVVASAPGIGSDRVVQNFTWIIVSDRLESGRVVFTVYRLSGSRVEFMSVIERIGETQYYKLIRGDAQGKTHEERFELSDLYSFGYQYRDSFRTATSTVSFKAFKKYPTRSLYQDAKRQFEEEASKPMLWKGSGFAIKDGYLVTNYHVINEAESISIRGINGDFSIPFVANVVASDAKNDLAILRIVDNRFSGYDNIPFAIKSSTAEVGEDVFVLGYPLTATMGDEIKYTNGVISSKTGFQGDISSYQISAPVQPGNSGGPLFDSKGNIIGVVSGKHADAENVGYAIKASYLQSLIESFSSGLVPTNNTVSSNSRPDQIKFIKNFIFLIECTRENSSSIQKTVPSPVVVQKSIPSSSDVIPMNPIGNKDKLNIYLNLKVGETRIYGISGVEWIVEQPTIVSVKDGAITGKMKGKAIVRARKDGKDVKVYLF